MSTSSTPRVAPEQQPERSQPSTSPLVPQSVPEPLEAYRVRRRTFHRRVRDHLRSEHAALLLRGSFARGDFHLRRHDVTTYSDVDLILPGVREDVRFVLADEVADGLRRAGLALPVSVQPMDAFTQLPEPTSRYVHLGEFIRRSARDAGDGPKQDYLRAKLALSLTGRAPGRQPSVLARATEVKLGLSEAFAPADFRALVPPHATGYHAERPYLELAGGLRTFDRALADAYVAGLGGLLGLPGWLRGLMTRLVSETITG